MNHRVINAALFLIISLFVLILFLWRPVERTYSLPSQTETPSQTGTPTQTGTPAASFFVPYIAAADHPSATPTPTPTATATAPVSSPEEELVERETVLRIDAVRSAQGLPDLVVVDELTQSARRHSRYMADFAGPNPEHEGPEGVLDVIACWRRVRCGPRAMKSSVGDLEAIRPR